jgi:hypothetical protein
MPGQTWVVIRRTEDTHWCGCPRHHHSARCRHVEAVDDLIQREAREAVAASTPQSRAAAAGRLAQLEREFSV